MLELELYHGHPLLKAFIMILQEQVHDTKMGKGAHYNNGLVVEVGCECFSSTRVQCSRT